MAYLTERSGFTAPKGKGGVGTPYHVDLKLLSSLPVAERVKMFDALAKQKQAIGREIEFSNPAVSGRRWNPNAELAEKVDLLEKAAAAHSHSQHTGWQSFDYYLPFKGKSRFEKGAVEDASIYIPAVAGGKVRRGSGGGYGYFSESLDPSGKVIARVGHGNIDRPEAGDVNVMGSAPVAPQLPAATTSPDARTEEILKAFLYGTQAGQGTKQKTLQQEVKEQLLGNVLSQALNPTSFLSSYNSTDPYMTGFNAGSKDFFAGLLG
jgi:hypothetical protein